ncbi:MAG: methyltransferase domain-containing protein [Candidatus Hodarchaeales archaeon]|jgi:SAM-dependent methyltransferase
MPTAEQIQKSYKEALKNAKNKSNDNLSCCSPSDTSCCPPSETSGLIKITEEEPQSISFGCIRMNDILNENLKTGNTIIDFGSGPGHDLLLAAKRIGPSGRAIGVDFTDEMHDEVRLKAKENGLTNVELVKSNIENVDLPDGLADVIISNCVINLANSKANVFNEVFRLLKPGGILIDADVISNMDIPEDLRNNKELWCGCTSGALTVDGYKQHLINSGFKDIKVDLDPNDLVTYDNKEFGIFSGIIWAKKPE